MIDAKQARIKALENHEKRINKMTENLMEEIANRIDSTVAFGEMSISYHLKDENGIEEVIRKVSILLRKLGFKVKYDTEWEYSTTTSLTGEDPMNYYYHLLDISWDEDEQDNS